MIIAGHPPNYLPYIGFLHKMTLCDTFVLVDHIQYEKKGWENRNRIRTHDGWQWLTVPVLTKGKFSQSVSQVQINNTINWGPKHWRAIYLNYGRAPYFSKHADFFEDVYCREWTLLADLSQALLQYLMRELGIEVKIIRSSELEAQGQKTELLIDLCRKLKGDTYLSGPGGRGYVDQAQFREAGLNHLFQDFQHPTYPQQWDPFVSGMSSIDLLFNCGAEESWDILLRSGGVSVS